MKAGQTPNLRTKYLQAANMVDRYEKMQGQEKAAFADSLRANPKLRDFLAKAILHLKLYGNEGSINHDIAHFLMGDFSGEQLPKELATWVKNNEFQPTPDLREKLNDLLRTFQNGWSKEDFRKTINKLEFLAAEVEKIVDTSFSGGTTGGINQDAVEKWMFKGEKNLWIADSKIRDSDLNSVKPETNIADLKPLGKGPLSKTIFIHKGKVTDLSEKHSDSTITTIVLRTTPDLLLCNGSPAAQSVVTAAGAGLQTEIFENHGLPNTSGIAKKLDLPSGPIFTASCGSHDMQDSHGINQIFITNEDTQQKHKDSRWAISERDYISAEILRNSNGDKPAEKKRNIIMPVDLQTDDIELAIELAVGNPKKHLEAPEKLILVFDSDVSNVQIDSIRKTVREREETLTKQAQRQVTEASRYL